MMCPDLDGLEVMGAVNDEPMVCTAGSYIFAVRRGCDGQDAISVTLVILVL